MEVKEIVDESFSTTKISATTTRGSSPAQSQTQSPMIPLLRSHSSEHNHQTLKDKTTQNDALLLLNLSCFSQTNKDNSNHDLHAEASSANEAHVNYTRECSNDLTKFVHYESSGSLKSSATSQGGGMISLPFVDSVDTSNAQHPIMKNTTCAKHVSNSSLKEDNSKMNHLSKNLFFGTISLSMQDDVDSLSPLHIFIRKYGIEAFVATEEEANYIEFWKLKNFKVIPGRVGIQCIHCRHLPLVQRGPKAVHYPMTISNLYNSLVNWYHVHASSCSMIPLQIKEELKQIEDRTKGCAGGRRRYWTEAAIKLGMEDTPQGIIFSSYPLMHEQPKESCEHRPKVSSTLVTEKDKENTSEYLFLLMSQMEPCKYTDEDRAMSRSKIKNDIGFPGLQCIHCHGKSGIGRYFPVSRKSFCLTNSDRNMFNHLTKCRKCPDPIKKRLIRLDMTRKHRELPRGTRKNFLTCVWNKLHSIEMHQMENDQIDISRVCKERKSPIEEPLMEDFQIVQECLVESSSDNYQEVNLSDFPCTEFESIFERIMEEDFASIPDAHDFIESALRYPE
jgi:hypothetical protein